MNRWYPNQIKVPELSQQISFMETLFSSEDFFRYAEFGIYKGATADSICSSFPKAELHLFDYIDVIEQVKPRLDIYKNNINYYGNSYKYNDSYNYSLIKIIENKKEFFDYCFLDGAHTIAIDALTFFLCDKVLKVGGYMDFDDYTWKLRGSSLDPSKVPEIYSQYTDEQIDSYQVKIIVDTLVKKDLRYEEVVKNKIYRKIKE